MSRHVVLLVIGLCLWASPAAGVEFHNISTSTAFGTFTPPSGFGAPVNLVTSMTPLSNDIDQSPTGPSLTTGITQMLKADTLVPAPFGDLFISEFGTLDNLTFMTSTLPNFGDADDALVGELNQLLTDLQAANPLVTFTPTVTPAGDRFLATENYGLTAIDFTPEPDVVHVGSIDVDIFRIDMTVTATQTPGPGPAVPEPASAVLGAVGLTLLAARRRRG